MQLDDTINENKAVTLTDENGNESDYIFTDTIPYEGKNYGVFVPVDLDDNTVVILEVESENEKDDEATLTGVEDDALLDKLYEIFKNKHSEDFDFT